MTATDDIRLISQGAPDPALISPARDSRYSTSLYLHLKRLRSSQRARYTGWLDVNGSIWIGYRDGPWFFGERLAKVLQEPTVRMADPRGWRYSAHWLDAIVRLRSLFDIPRPRSTGNEFHPIENFWDEYLQHGRCFLDPDHKLEFRDYLNPNKGWRSLLRPLPLIREERWATHLADDQDLPNVMSELVCKWCGHRQLGRTWSKPVGRAEWVSASEAPAAKA